MTFSRSALTMIFHCSFERESLRGDTPTPYLLNLDCPFDDAGLIGIQTLPDPLQVRFVSNVLESNPANKAKASLFVATLPAAARNHTLNLRCERRYFRRELRPILRGDHADVYQSSAKRHRDYPMSEHVTNELSHYCRSDLWSTDCPSTIVCGRIRRFCRASRSSDTLRE